MLIPAMSQGKILMNAASRPPMVLLGESTRQTRNVLALFGQAFLVKLTANDVQQQEGNGHGCAEQTPELASLRIRIEQMAMTERAVFEVFDQLTNTVETEDMSTRESHGIGIAVSAKGAYVVRIENVAGWWAETGQEALRRRQLRYVSEFQCSTPSGSDQI